MSADGMAWISWALTHAGAVRQVNQDSIVQRPDLGLWAVADGAGGHEQGEFASALVAKMIEDLPAPMAAATLVAEVRTVIAEAHRALRARADAEAAQSGAPVIIATTIVVFLASDWHYACLWAGDSRAYRFREGMLLRLTRDHSLVQSLVESGVLTEAEAEVHPQANIVTRALGDDSPDLELDKVTDRAALRDRYLLCTDGLTKALDEPRIASLMSGNDPAADLMAAALDSGARDNISVIVLECGSRIR